MYSQGTSIPFRYTPIRWYKRADLYIFPLIAIIVFIIMYCMQDGDPDARRRAWAKREHDQEMQQAYDAEMARLKARGDYDAQPHPKGTL